jgi:hypothetical protein
MWISKEKLEELKIELEHKAWVEARRREDEERIHTRLAALERRVFTLEGGLGNLADSCGDSCKCKR